MKLRENQILPVKIGIEYFQQKKADPSLIVAPPAFGKSHVIAAIVESIPDNVLVLQPGSELLTQNLGKFTAMGGKATVYSAAFGSKRISRVTYASIGSIKNIGKRFKEMGFTKMIVDEADSYPRNSDTSMFGQFIKESGITHVLGLTASALKLQSNMDQYGRPYSKLVMLTANSKKGRFYKDIISVSQIQDIIKLGFWSKLHYEEYLMDETGLRYNSTMADFTEESIKKVYESNDIHGKIIQKIIDLPNRKSILVFAPSIADAMTLATRIPGAGVVYSGMPQKDRDRITAGFKALRIRIVINVNIYAIGFDHPQLDAIIDGFPTGSLTRYFQRWCRGVRIHPLKADCLIVDFAGNLKRFGKIEHLHYEKVGNLWHLYGEHDNLLSGIPLHEIGLYKKTPQSVKVQAAATGDMVWIFGKTHGGKLVSQLPKEYREWVLGNFSWNDSNMKFKEALLKLK